MCVVILIHLLFVTMLRQWLYSMVGILSCVIYDSYFQVCNWHDVYILQSWCCIYLGCLLALCFRSFTYSNILRHFWVNYPHMLLRISMLRYDISCNKLRINHLCINFKELIAERQYNTTTLIVNKQIKTQLFLKFFF